MQSRDAATRHWKQTSHLLRVRFTKLQMTCYIDIKHLLCFVCGSVVLGSKKLLYSTLGEIQIHHFVYLILSQSIWGNKTVSWSYFVTKQQTNRKLNVSFRRRNNFNNINNIAILFWHIIKEIYISVNFVLMFKGCLQYKAQTIH